MSVLGDAAHAGDRGVQLRQQRVGVDEQCGA